MSDREVRYRINAQDGVSSVLKQIEGAASSTTTKMFGMKNILSAITGAVGGFTVATVVKGIIDLGVASDKTFRQIAAILPTFTQGIGKLKDDVAQIAIQSGLSLQDMQAAALQIAHLGVSGAEEVAERLKAATMLSVASGTDLHVVISGLDQIMDLFGLTADKAAGMLANMFSAAKGRVDMEGLIDAFQTVGPLMHDLGATADETTKALVALLDSGKNGREIKKIIGERDLDSIRLIASQAHISSTALDELQRSFDEVRASSASASEALKSNVGAAATDLGDKLRPVRDILIEMAGGVLAVSKLALFGGKFASPLDTDPTLNKALAKGGKASVNAPIDLGLTKTEKDQIAAQRDEIANLKALNDAYDQSEIAIKELAIAHENLKQKLEHTKEANAAVRATLDAGSDAIAAQKEQALGLAIAHALLESTLDKVTAALAKTEVAGQHSAKITQDIINVDDLLNKGKEDLPGILAKNNAAIKQQTDDLNEKLDENEQRIMKVANAWASVGRSAIGAAQAIGKMDSATAAALQNAVTLGQGLAELYGSGGKAGGAEAAAGLGGLIASITDMGHAASRAQQQAAELAQTIGKLFTGLESEIHGSGSLADRYAAGVSEYADARNSVERNLGGKAKQTEREEALDRLDKLEAERLQQITDEYELEQKQMQEDDHVRLLRAEGFTAEADAEEFAEQQQREYAEALKNSGLSAEDFAASATGMGRAAAQAAEAIDFAADQTRKAAESALSGATKTADQDIQIDRITDPGKQFAEKAKAYQKAGGDIGKLFDGFDLDNLSAADIAALDERLRMFFHTLKDSPNTVDAAGLSIDDLISGVLDLDNAATRAADGIASAADSINAALSQLSDSEDVYGTDPVSHAYNTISATGLNMPGFDLTTQGGKDAAIKYFQDEYGTASKDQKGLIKTAIDAIRAIPDASSALAGAGGPSSLGGSSSAAAQAFQSLTTVQGDDLRNILFQSLDVQRGMGVDLSAIRQSMVIRVPSFSGVNISGATKAFGGAPGAASDVSIGPLNINVVSLSDDPKAIGAIVGEEVVRVLDAKFGRRIHVQKKYNGDIGTTPS